MLSRVEGTCVVLHRSRVLFGKLVMGSGKGFALVSWLGISSGHFSLELLICPRINDILRHVQRTCHVVVIPPHPFFSLIFVMLLRISYVSYDNICFLPDNILMGVSQSGLIKLLAWSIGISIICTNLLFIIDVYCHCSILDSLCYWDSVFSCVLCLYLVLLIAASLVSFPFL